VWLSAVESIAATLLGGLQIKKNAEFRRSVVVMIWFTRWVKNFFGLSRAQSNGIVVLLPLLGIIMFSEPLWHAYVSGREEDYASSRAKLDSLIEDWSDEVEIEDQEAVSDRPSIRLSSFDPNTEPLDKLRELGFSAALSLRLIHYREKGGKFIVKKDLLKIYGMDSAFFEQLHPYIDLPEKIEAKPEIVERPSLKRLPVAKFDINLADTSQLKRVYGIGSRLSQRIVKYRDALGGFIAIDQLKEVYGLDTAVVNRLVRMSFLEEDFEPRKININQADEAEMAVHPYLRMAVARAIVTYRFQHGEFESLDDLRKIHALDDQTIQKITPYLTVED